MLRQQRIQSIVIALAIMLFTYILLGAGNTNAQVADEVRLLPETTYTSLSINAAPLTAKNDRLYTPQSIPLRLQLPISGGVQPYAITVPERIEGGTLIENTATLLTFIPDPDFTGQMVIPYDITDATNTTTSASITIDVGGVLDTNNRTAMTTIDQPVDVFGVMQGGFPPYTIEAISTANGTITPLPDGGFTYIPAAGFVGADSINVSVTDATGAQVVSTVNVRVTANRTPIQAATRLLRVLDSTADTLPNTATTLHMGGNNPATHRYQITQLPENGAVVRVAPNKVLYVPNANYTGEDQIGYQVIDIAGNTTEATISITVDNLTLPSPNSIAVTIPDGVPLLTWEDAPETAQHIIIQRNTANTGWREISRLPISTDEFEDFTANCGTRYRYRAYFSRESGLTSPPTTAVLATTPSCIALALSASQVDDSITVTWADETDDNLRLERRRLGGQNTWQPLTDGPFIDESFTDEDVICGRTYLYRLRMTDIPPTYSQITTPVSVTCPPTVITPADQSHRVGERVQLNIHATDAFERPIQFAANGLPPGLQIDANDGLISGGVRWDAATDTPYAVTVAVTTAEDEITEITFNWQIIPAENNTPTNLTVDGNLTSAPVQPTFRWTHTPLAEVDPAIMQYRLLVYQDNREIINTWYDATTICDGVDCTVQSQLQSLTGLLNGDYAWWVQAFDGEVTAWSHPDGRPFTVEVPAPVKPVIVSPGDVSEQIVTDFTWQADPNALWYRLTVSNLLDEWISAADICTENLCTVSRVLGSGVYEWNVVAWGPGGQRSAADADDLVVLVNLARPQVPQNILVDPRQGRPAISWDADPNALWYNLYIGRNDSLSFDEWFDARLACADDRCTVIPEIDWNSGSYEVWVQAWGPNGYSGLDGSSTLESWGQGPNLVLPETPASSPTNITVTTTNGNRDSTPSLTWRSGTHTTWFEIHLHGADGNEVFSRWYRAGEIGCAAPGQVCTTTADETLQTLLTSGESYVLSVRGWGPGGYSDPTTVTIPTP